MAYTAKEIIDDVLGRIDDEENKISRKWLLHLLNMACIEYAKRTKSFRKEYSHTINTLYNAFALPENVLEIKNVKYSVDGVDWQQLYPMNLSERQRFEKKIMVA